MQEKVIKKIEQVKEPIIILVLFIWMSIPLLKKIRITCVPVFSYEYTYMKIVGAIGLVLLLVEIGKKLYTKKNIKEYEKQILPITILGIFLIWTFISCLFSPNKINAFCGTDYRKDGLISYLAYGGFLSCAFLLKSKKSKKILFNSFIGLAIANIIVVELYNKGIGSTIFAGREITRTCFYNINHYGYYLLLATTTANFLFVTEKNKYKKVIYMLVYMLLMYYLILNNTLGCYLALAVTLVIFFIYTLVCKQKRRVALISILLLVALSFMGQETKNVTGANIKNLATDVNNILILGNKNEEKTEKMIQAANHAGSGRIQIWKYGIKFFMERPILGYGPENLEIKYNEVGIDQDRPHNLIIQMATTSGIIGVITYFTAIGMILLTAIKYIKMENEIYIISLETVVAYLISAMFGNSMYYTSPYFFIFLGLLLYENIKQKEKKMEYLDLYDKEGNLTGETMKRGDRVPEGRYFNVVVCYIENSEGKFLIQKTSKEKGGKYSSTGGHVKSGQSLIEAMICEIKEEIGVDVKEEELKYITKYIKNNEVIFNLYYIRKEINIEECTLQKEEVESISWMIAEEIEKLNKQGKFYPTHALLFERIKSG